MTKGLIILLIATVIIHVSNELDTDTSSQSKYPRYEFVLHKCIASAELNRKYQNKERPNINASKPVQSFLHKAYVSFTMEGKNSTSQVHPTTVPINLKSNNNHSFHKSETSHNNMSVKRLFTKNIGNTPLRTLNIKSMQSSLPIYTKKNLLPEIENATIKTRNSSQSVIVIKSAV